MSLSNLSGAQLAQLVELAKEKESLEVKLDRVNAALQALESGKPAAKKRGRKPGRPAGTKKAAAVVGEKARRGKRLKQPLLKALSAAGSSGITVKELATKLKVKPGNIFSWFYTTGKKISGIKKVGEAKYAYTS
jgi:DNA invertase Pin-like site-specific DNA recombinase